MMVVGPAYSIAVPLELVTKENNVSSVLLYSVYRYLVLQRQDVISGQRGDDVNWDCLQPRQQKILTGYCLLLGI